MPNKRAANKKNINIWIQKDIYYDFTLLAKYLGETKTNLLTEYIKDIISNNRDIISRLRQS